MRSIEAGGMKLLDQRLRQSRLALDLVAMAADDRPQSGRGLHRRLGIDVGRQAPVFRNLPHWAGMFRWPSGGVKRYTKLGLRAGEMRR